MKTIYQLKSDKKTLDSMQTGSLDSKSVLGLKITHGLVGSEEWWEFISSGALRLHTISGIVSGFWPGQWGDGPAEFEIQEENGKRSIWFCKKEPNEASTLFIVGRPVELDYVLQELKTPFNGSSQSQVCLSIRLGSLTSPSSGRASPAAED
jgi:hypothetical protein